MKKITLLFLMCFSLLGISGQTIPFKYRIQFTDKNNSPYSIGNPSAYLSQRAIERRNNAGISIYENDLPVNPYYLDSVANTGVTLLNPSKWFNAVTIMSTDTVALAKIQGFPFVKEVQVVAKTTVSKQLPAKTATPDKFNEMIENLSPQVSKSPSSTAGYNYGPSYGQIHMIRGDSLHALGYKGKGMIIAILDAGFQNADLFPAFDSLWMNDRILGTRDFVNPGGNVFAEHWHGMMVLSLMGGNLPGQLVGTAPEASYWLLRSEDVNSEYLIEEDNWISAAEFADSAGVDVINSSLGYNIFDDPAMNHSYLDMNGHTTRISIGAATAAAKGILVVNSAGNSGGTAWQYITAPADADSIIAVGAVNSNGSYSSFSSTGPSSDGRVKPDVSAQGSGDVVSSLTGGISFGSGTSFSSPITAGASACLWQTRRSASNMQVYQAILQSSSQFYNPDSLLGYGIPDFVKARDLLLQSSIPESEPASFVKVFPNPFQSEIYILMPPGKAQNLRVRICDVTGKVMIVKEITGQQGPGPIRIRDLSSLKPGIYLIQIISGNHSFNQKLIRTL